MAVPSDPPPDDVSLVVVLIDVNPYFWGCSNMDFSLFLGHALSFVNAISLLNHMNEIVAIAVGCNSCAFLYDSFEDLKSKSKPSTKILEKLKEFIAKDTEKLVGEKKFSLLSGALSMALCYVQRKLRTDALHPRPRILCLQGSPDAPQQYIAVMNAIFSAQRSMIPIDSCMVGIQQSSFLQQAAHITGGIHMKPAQFDGLFQYLVMVFAADLYSRRFLQLPQPTGVDFRASCFCHKKTIDMGFICSVCLSIFCKQQKECSTCGAQFSQKVPNIIGIKRKQPAT